MKNKKWWTVLLMFPVLYMSQTYTYQWAKTGGGSNGSSDVGFNQKDDEHILDIAVDNQNNSYYITSMYDGTPLLDGQTVTNYGSRDIVLFSTDCQGNIRWKRTIGGGGVSTERTQKIVLDNNGGLYLTFAVGNSSSVSSGQYLPPRFGDNDVLPLVSNDFFQPQTALKYGFLLKYNTADGNLVWRKDFQGDVNVNNMAMEFSPPVIDSQNILHVIVGLKFGTHLNGMVTVPSTFDASTSNFQYYLVKYDSSGNIVGTPSLLPITGSTTFLGGYLSFMYDEANNRYYLAGSRNYEGSGSNGYALSYNNVPIVGSGFMLAFSSTTFAELWRREEIINNPIGATFITGLKKDPITSDIYLSGKFGRVTQTVSFGSDFTFNSPLTGSIGFVMKLGTSNSSSNVLWCTYPTSLSDGSTDTAMQNARMPIAFKGNEVLFAKGSIREVWGAFPMVRPVNDRTDPLLVRLNKDTGVVTGTYEVQGSYGAEDHFTAVAVDNDNNIMLGGFIHQQLFTATNDNVVTISNVLSDKSNFFFAKLASSACSTMSVEETSAEAGLQFYPNPVTDVLHIKSKNKLESFEIYSSVGQTVQRGGLQDTNAQITMSSLPTGVYYVKVKTEKAVVTEKVVKK
ncbi:T9SS type A sorting domain-containing protein [Chryseobacterium taiwanense]|nr:T9SS type A sorting domain-containing protein [Chryseobacterium taiwanense]